MFKVSIIGAGNVGASVAHSLALSQLAEIVLVDINGGVATGKALDLTQTGPIQDHGARLSGGASYEDTEDSDVVVITAGVARKPGMSRDDLLTINAEIVSSAARSAFKLSPDAIFVVVSNPLDVMTTLVQQVTGLDSERVIGMAGVLDSARLESFIAAELGISPRDVKAMVLGGHGDLMVPLPRHSSVKGIPIADLIPDTTVTALLKRTANGGGEIVQHLKTGSAFFAPGAAAAQIVKAILLNENLLIPCSVLPQGEYGLEGVYVGLPVIIGRCGVDKIIELRLNAEELAALKKSADSIKEQVTLMNKLLAAKNESATVESGKTAEPAATVAPAKTAEPAATVAPAKTAEKPATPPHAGDATKKS